LVLLILLGNILNNKWPKSLERYVKKIKTFTCKKQKKILKISSKVLNGIKIKEKGKLCGNDGKWRHSSNCSFWLWQQKVNFKRQTYYD
jgi:hypothetical protein